jgi:hypothetical protein
VKKPSDLLALSEIEFGRLIRKLKRSASYKLGISTLLGADSDEYFLFQNQLSEFHHELILVKPVGGSVDYYATKILILGEVAKVDPTRYVSTIEPGLITAWLGCVLALKSLLEYFLNTAIFSNKEQTFHLEVLLSDLTQIILRYTSNAI